MRTEKKQNGFTLMEMLIVVAVIAVLAAVAIPTISKSVHRSQEMADVANVRAYFAFLQADYMSTGEYRPEISDGTRHDYVNTIKYPDGTTIELKVGYMCVLRPGEGASSSTSGYQIHYFCGTKNADNISYSCDGYDITFGA